MTLFNNLILSLIQLISLRLEIDCNKKEILDFVNRQLNNSPNYIRISIYFLTSIFILFNKITSIFFFKKEINVLKSSINFIKRNKILIFYDLVRFYESLIILKLMELYDN